MQACVVHKAYLTCPGHIRSTALLWRQSFVHVALLLGDCCMLAGLPVHCAMLPWDCCKQAFIHCVRHSACPFLGPPANQLFSMQVVQCLHSCFLYDTVSFLDEARFHRLLPMLVSQLAAQPPAAVSEQLVMQHAHNAAAPAENGSGSDPFGQAVVAALVQMAVTANNDALWKSLNHQVCAWEHPT